MLKLYLLNSMSPLWAIDRLYSYEMLRSITTDGSFPFEITE